MAGKELRICFKVTIRALNHEMIVLTYGAD